VGKKGWIRGGRVAGEGSGGGFWAGGGSSVQLLMTRSVGFIRTAIERVVAPPGANLLVRGADAEEYCRYQEPKVPYRSPSWGRTWKGNIAFREEEQVPFIGEPETAEYLKK